MSTPRHISLPVHGALEFVIGVAAMLAALGLAASPAGTVILFGAGASIVTLALTTTPTPAGATSLPVSSHRAADHGLALGLAGAAALLALSGDAIAAGALALVVLVSTALSLWTRYTARA